MYNQNSKKGQKDMIMKDEAPRSVRVQYANEEEWREIPIIKLH